VVGGGRTSCSDQGFFDYIFCRHNQYISRGNGYVDHRQNIVLSIIKGDVSLGFRNSEFPRVSSRFRLVPSKVLPVSRCPVGSSVLKSLSCGLSKVFLELDLVGKPGF